MPVDCHMTGTIFSWHRTLSQSGAAELESATMLSQRLSTFHHVAGEKGLPELTRERHIWMVTWQILILIQHSVGN